MNLLRTLHAWIGAVLALILIVEGLTGALLVLKPDYLRLTIPQARAHVAPTPQVLGAVANAAQAMHKHHIVRIEFAGPELGIHQVIQHDGTTYEAADGRMIAHFQGIRRPEAFVYELHHFLLLGDTGMRAAGLAALVAVFLALTGIIVWAPVWRTFSLRLWPRSAQRRELLAAHRSLGALFALPVVLFCLTGAGLIFFKTTQGLFLKAFPETTEEQFFTPAYPGEVDWVNALAAAQAAVPDGRLRMAIFPPEAGDAAVVRLKRPNEWTPYGDTEVLIDPSSNTAMGVRYDPRKATRLYKGLYPLHIAAVGGRLYDLFAVLSGLALAGLGVIGLWSFLRKQLRYGASRKPSAVSASPGASDIA